MQNLNEFATGMGEDGSKLQTAYTDAQNYINSMKKAMEDFNKSQEKGRWPLNIAAQ